MSLVLQYYSFISNTLQLSGSRPWNLQYATNVITALHSTSPLLRVRLKARLESWRIVPAVRLCSEARVNSLRPSRVCVRWSGEALYYRYYLVCGCGGGGGGSVLRGEEGWGRGTNVLNGNRSPRLATRPGGRRLRLCSRSQSVSQSPHPVVHVIALLARLSSIRSTS